MRWCPFGQIPSDASRLDFIAWMVKSAQANDQKRQPGLLYCLQRTGAKSQWQIVFFF
jgi:hypothetical protein